MSSALVGGFFTTEPPEEPDSFETIILLRLQDIGLCAMGKQEIGT